MPFCRTIRLRTGQTARLLNVSAAGASLETAARLAPGLAADLVLAAGTATHVARAVVIYAHVCAVHPTRGAHYRVGVRWSDGSHVHAVRQRVG
jgi:uncharacterized protein (DUF1501 family)